MATSEGEDYATSEHSGSGGIITTSTTTAASKRAKHRSQEDDDDAANSIGSTIIPLDKIREHAFVGLSMASSSASTPVHDLLLGSMVSTIASVVADKSTALIKDTIAVTATPSIELITRATTSVSRASSGGKVEIDDSAGASVNKKRQSRTPGAKALTLTNNKKDLSVPHSSPRQQDDNLNRQVLKKTTASLTVAVNESASIIKNVTMKASSGKRKKGDKEEGESAGLIATVV